MITPISDCLKAFRNLSEPMPSEIFDKETKRFPKTSQQFLLIMMKGMEKSKGKKRAYQNNRMPEHQETRIPEKFARFQT
jgi:hypothetical protein